jgi:uncharacterized repeat protein (TIGR03803 family)
MQLSMSARYAFSVTLAATLAACANSSPGSQALPAGASGAVQSHHKAHPTVTESVLYSFAGGSDGQYPKAGLIYVNGALYGTTQLGGGFNSSCQEGPNSCGVVFEVASGTETVVHRFAGGNDGANPISGLVLQHGNLYGATEFGGTGSNGNCFQPVGCGTVYEIPGFGNEEVLHSFADGSDGAFPNSGSLVNVGGALYGTTGDGGAYNRGTVFKITRSGTESVVYSFGDGSADGTFPSNGLINVGGVLYGMTSTGGAYGGGTVFKMTTSGTETILYNFGSVSGDGLDPLSGLTKVGSAFYGTTSGGGTSDNGTVFKVTLAGAETVLHSFTNGKDGSAPEAGLTKVGNELYGTTSAGGATHNGTVFLVTTRGATLLTLYSFAGGTDGSQPVAPLTYDDGTLYGTTAAGGKDNDGTVFSITL